jgi:hypothetical protein
VISLNELRVPVPMPYPPATTMVATAEVDDRPGRFRVRMASGMSTGVGGDAEPVG